MTHEQQVPSLVLRLVCDSVIDNLGEKSLRLLFAQSGLQHVYSGGELPPADETPSITVEQLSRLFATAYRVFGDKGVRPILLRAGRTMLHYFRAHNKPLAALAGAAFKVLPTDAKIKLLLSRTTKVAEELLHAPHSSRSTSEGYIIEIQSCPYCAGTTAEKPVCYFPVGFYTEALRWATGDSYTVTETECVASGGTLCRFLIGKEQASA